MNIATLRQHILLLAEAFDAWRVIPRIMVLAYGYLVFNLYIWYKNIPTYVEEKCDSVIVATLIEKGMALREIKAFACTVVDVVGGPTTAQSTFVTTIIGLSTGIFGLYATTGRKWDGWEPNFNNGNLTYVQQKVPVMHPDGSVTMEPVSPQAPKTNIQIFAKQDNVTTTEEVVSAPDDEEETPAP